MCALRLRCAVGRERPQPRHRDRRDEDRWGVLQGRPSTACLDHSVAAPMASTQSGTALEEGGLGVSYRRVKRGLMLRQEAAFQLRESRAPPCGFTYQQTLQILNGSLTAPVPVQRHATSRHTVVAAVRLDRGSGSTVDGGDVECFGTCYTELAQPRLCPGRGTRPSAPSKPRTSVGYAASRANLRETERFAHFLPHLPLPSPPPRLLRSPITPPQDPEGNFARGKEEISAAAAAMRQALQVTSSAYGTSCNTVPCRNIPPQHCTHSPSISDHQRSC